MTHHTLMITNCAMQTQHTIQQYIIIILLKIIKKVSPNKYFFLSLQVKMLYTLSPQREYLHLHNNLIINFSRHSTL